MERGVRVRHRPEERNAEQGSQYVSRLRSAHEPFCPGTRITDLGRDHQVSGDPNGPFHGIYLGAGPYVSLHTTAAIDPALVAVFASTVPVYVPNTSFSISSDTLSQAAVAVTGGYRGRFALPGAVGFVRIEDPYSAPEGLYVGMNVHYLHGFSYEHFEPDARLDTNAQGLLVVDAAKGLPVTIVRTTSTTGDGFAIDAGVAAVIDKWELGLGVNGIANRIDWRSVRRTNYVLDSLFAGGDFVDLPAVPVADVRVELPVDVRVHGAYNAGPWLAIADTATATTGPPFAGAIEQRLGRVQLRGGARYVNDRWEPTGGVGFNLTDGFGVDVGLFGTSANLERKRHLAIAVSLRLMHTRYRYAGGG